MKNINPLTAADFYKADHRSQYPKGTEYVYSNFTPRSNKLANFIQDQHEDKIVFFGLQYFIKYFLMEVWQEGFFDQPKEKVIAQYKRRMDNALGPDAFTFDHIAALHDLGYLPIEIKALPEGSRVPIGVPVLTIVNTDPKFFWLTNYLETVMSSFLWKPITSATTAYEYKRLLVDFALNTSSPVDFVPFQAHDFSFRGSSGLNDAALSGAGHLTSFVGTDTIPAIDLLEQYYGADVEKEMVGVSVPATEHSVMSIGQKESEIDTFKRLINDVYPTGIVSIVSDTWDLFKVVTEYVRELKGDILAREGKVVIRPDSGDPVKIIVGDPEAPVGSPEHKGVVECLWDIFRGTTFKGGYRMLDPHIGVIYGDSITLDRAKNILEGLKAKGFCSGNMVLGVGSYTYQYVTRDTHGFAMKATAGEVNGELREIFKNPKTDDGTKKSAKGLLKVAQEDGEYVLHDQQSKIEESRGCLRSVYRNGCLLRVTTLKEVRRRLEVS